MSSFNPTTKTLEALQTAVQLASAKGNPDVRPAHLLVGVLDQPDGIAAPALQAAGADPKAVLDAARKLVDSFPSAQGSNMANPRRNWPVNSATSMCPLRCCSQVLHAAIPMRHNC